MAKEFKKGNIAAAGAGVTGVALLILAAVLGIKTNKKQELLSDNITVVPSESSDDDADESTEEE